MDHLTPEEEKEFIYWLHMNGYYKRGINYCRHGFYTSMGERRIYFQTKLKNEFKSEKENKLKE